MRGFDHEVEQLNEVAATTIRIVGIDSGSISGGSTIHVSTTTTSCGGTPTATSTGTPPPSPTNTNTSTATPTPSCSSSGKPGPTQPPARYSIQGVIGSDNKLYIAGGQSADATPVLSNQVSRFDPTTNTWRTLRPCLLQLVKRPRERGTARSMWPAASSAARR